MSQQLSADNVAVARSLSGSCYDVVNRNNSPNTFNEYRLSVTLEDSKQQRPPQTGSL